MAFSPDGHTLATGSSDDTIRLWNVTNPAHPTPIGQPLTGPAAAVDSVTFSPDGHTLATGTYDDTSRLWNVTNPAHPTPIGQPLTGPDKPSSRWRSAPTGTPWPPAARRHDPAVGSRPDHAIHRICATTSGNLTPEQWAATFPPPYDPPCRHP